jgi:hypothetical protein
MPKQPAPKKRKVRYLTEVPAKVHLRPRSLKIIVEIPWADLERRLHTPVKAAAKRFRRKTRKPPIKPPS